MEKAQVYDLIIVGGGPAGLTASIYASCFHLKHLLIGKDLGGQMKLAPDILNYPGFEEISGRELTERMIRQVKKRGGELLTQSVTRISHRREENGFRVETEGGKIYQTKSVILATGTERRKLNVPGEVEYTGKGVYYCATCEKQDYNGKVCGVVGGANSAVQAAVELAQAAGKVYIIYRGSQLRGDAVWLDKIDKSSKIEIVYKTVVKEIIGDGSKVTGVKLISNAEDKEEKSLSLDKLFIEIGGVPGTALVIPLGVAVDKKGYLKVDDQLATNIPGVFAAGDLVSYGLSIEQISTAVGLGARAAASTFAYIKKEKTPLVWGESQIRR